MAFYDKDKGIVYSIEDKETFQEVQVSFSPKGIRTPKANKIIKWILGDLENNNKNYEPKI